MLRNFGEIQTKNHIASLKLRNQLIHDWSDPVDPVHGCFPYVVDEMRATWVRWRRRTIDPPGSACGLYNTFQHAAGDRKQRGISVSSRVFLEVRFAVQL